MKTLSRLLRISSRRVTPATLPKHITNTPLNRPISSTPRRPVKQAADDPSFTSILDNPPELIRTGRRHGYGLIVLAIIPVTAFALGTWQVQRLKWKTDLIAKSEDRLVAPPLPLPPRIDPAAIPEFDYRRVLATGKFRHDQEMLIGPRMRDGEEGYMVVTPLEREGDGTTVLVNRGWISKSKRAQKDRKESLVDGVVTVEGLLREPWKKNMFTPNNRPDIGEFYFPDVVQMAQLTGSQPIWVEQTMGMLFRLPLWKTNVANAGITEPDLFKIYEYQEKGIPIGRQAEVNLRNNHAQYIFTW
jgi:surfeit locus 1 family protein